LEIAVKSSALIGRPLDYWGARALGFVWARDAIERLDTPDFKLGARYLLPSQLGDDLDETVPSSDGFCTCLPSDPVGSRWDFLVNFFSSHKGLGEQLAWQQKAEIEYNRAAADHGDIVRVRLPGCGWGPFSPTIGIAVVRAIVIRAFGDEVEDDGFTPAEILAEMPEPLLA
jgi:hypothetical protein